MPSSLTSPGSTPEGAPGTTPPASLFGLNPAEMKLLRQLFGEMAGRIGLDGGRILDGLGQGETLSDVLSLPPRFSEVLYSRAHTWFMAGRYDRAETLFRVLCVADGRTADYWVGYGVCLRKRNAVAEAAMAFATAAAIRPDWAVPHFHAADLAVAEQSWQLAEDHLAAFGACSASGLAEQMRQEAARLDRALKLRAELRGEAREP